LTAGTTKPAQRPILDMHTTAAIRMRCELASRKASPQALAWRLALWASTGMRPPRWQKHHHHHHHPGGVAKQSLVHADNHPPPRVGKRRQRHETRHSKRLCLRHHRRQGARAQRRE
jgi:hypothetical protein